MKREIFNGENYIFNTNTNRWIKENGTTARKYMRENNIPRIGNSESNRKAAYVAGPDLGVRGWSVRNFRSLHQVNTKTYVNSILSKVTPNMRNVSIKMRAINSVTGDSDYRSIKLKNITAAKLYEKITEKLINNRKDGSDFFYEHYVAQTNFFQLQYKQELVGNSGRKDFIILDTEYFKCRSYPGEEGDCLFAILRKGKHISKIRKELEYEGGVKIEDMEMIEEYFNVNINIFADNIKIKKKIKDTDKINSTTVKCEYEYYYQSNNTKDGDIYEILLKDNHYSLIVKKKELCFDPVCGDQLKIVGKKPIQLSKLAIKKSLMRQGRRIAGEKVINEDEIEKKLLFFDIETIFNPDTVCLLEPYSIAWHVAPFTNPTKFSEKNIEKFEEQVHFLKGKDCMEKFVEWLEYNSEGIKYILIGYNNSRFDNFPLLKCLINADLFTRMMFVQNSVLSLSFGGRHKTFDLCRFVMTSLKKACENFKIFPEKLEGFSHYEPQDAFMNGGWGNLNCWINENSENLIKYNKIDVLATEALFYSVRQAYMKMTNLDILDYLTLASLSYDKFKKISKESGYNIKPPKTEEDDDFIRSAIIGGRCQLFNSETENDELLACVDVKSLYPYVMLNRYFPDGDDYKYITKKEFTYDNLGIYNVKIIEQPKIKIIPLRTLHGDSLNWDFKDQIIKVMTSVELSCLERHGGKFKFIKDENNKIGIMWKNSTKDLFTKYFDPIKNEKTNQDELSKNKDPKCNPALRNIAKLLLNSLSGKQIQRNFKDTTEMVKNIKEEEKFFKQTYDQNLILTIGPYTLLNAKKKEDLIYKKNSAKPSYLGVFIYAHARTYMYDIVYSNYNTIYTDTDSGVLYRDEYIDFSKKYIKKYGEGNNEYYGLTTRKTGIKTMGSEFGQFEEEFDSENKTSESYFLGKKMYCVAMKDKKGILTDKSKYRLKGVNLERDRLISSTLVKEIKEKGKKISKEKDEKKKTKLEKEAIEYLYNLKKVLDKKYLEQEKMRDSDGNLVNKVALINCFRELDRGKAHFLCGQIKKTNKLMMKQIFSIKTVRRDGCIDEKDVI
jgi:hypothetical protein